MGKKKIDAHRDHPMCERNGRKIDNVPYGRTDLRLPSFRCQYSLATMHNAFGQRVRNASVLWIMAFQCAQRGARHRPAEREKKV